MIGRRRRRRVALRDLNLWVADHVHLPRAARSTPRARAEFVGLVAACVAEGASWDRILDALAVREPSRLVAELMPKDDR